MKLLIIRHADPDYEHNTITPFGWEEAHALAVYLKNVKIDKVYSSPMGRAIDAATPTCKVKGLEPEILSWAGEHMDYMSSHTLTPEHECTYRFSLQEGVCDFKDFTDGNRMETVESMIKNSDAFLAAHGYVRKGFFYHFDKHNEESIAVFCHGGFGGAWISHLLGVAPGLTYPTLSLNTSSVTTFEFRNSEKGYTRPIMTRMSEISHIRDAGLRINNR